MTLICEVMIYLKEVGVRGHHAWAVNVSQKIEDVRIKCGKIQFCECRDMRVIKRCG